MASTPVYLFSKKNSHVPHSGLPETFAGDLVAFDEAGESTGDFLRRFGQRFPVQRADHPFHATAYIFGAALQRLRFDDWHFLFTDCEMPTFATRNEATGHFFIVRRALREHGVFAFGVAIAEETASGESAPRLSATDTNSVLRMRLRIYVLPFEITACPSTDGPGCVAATYASYWSSSSV